MEHFETTTPHPDSDAAALALRLFDARQPRFFAPSRQPGAPDATNQLVAALPEEEAARLRPRLKQVQYTARQYVQVAGERIAAAIFPDKGWLYQIITLRNGDCSEAGIVGTEGMVGLPLLFGNDTGVTDLMAHAACSALRMEAGAFRASLDDCPTLRARLMQYALNQHAQSLQRAACNAHHSVEQRLARTILDASDRAGGRFMMTHELLSVLLGVRRAGVTVAAGSLQRAGLVRYSNGVVEVLDRTRLEGCACECRQLLAAHTRRRYCPGGDT